MAVSYDSLAKNYAQVILVGNRKLEDCPAKIKERTQYWLDQLTRGGTTSATTEDPAADPTDTQTEPTAEQPATDDAATEPITDTPASDQATN